MMCDDVNYRGVSWISTDEAAGLLGILPASLVRNHDTVRDLAAIDFVVWHRAWLWREDDVLAVARARGRGLKNVEIPTFPGCVSSLFVL